eukprot:751413-Hanusia_phi.AAC.3
MFKQKVEGRAGEAGSAHERQGTRLAHELLHIHPSQLWNEHEKFRRLNGQVEDMRVQLRELGYKWRNGPWPDRGTPGLPGKQVILPPTSSHLRHRLLLPLLLVPTLNLFLHPHSLIPPKALTGASWASRNQRSRRLAISPCHIRAPDAVTGPPGPPGPPGHKGKVVRQHVPRGEESDVCM